MFNFQGPNSKHRARFQWILANAYLISCQVELAFKHYKEIMDLKQMEDELSKEEVESWFITNLSQRLSQFKSTELQAASCLNQLGSFCYQASKFNLSSEGMILKCTKHHKKHKLMLKNFPLLNKSQWNVFQSFVSL